MSAVADLLLLLASIFVPFFGGVGIIILFYFRDVMEKESKKAILITSLWGLLVGVIIVAFTVALFYFANQITENLTAGWAVILVMISIVIIEAIVEEAIKGLLLWRRFLKLEDEVDGLFDGFYYGVIIGTAVGIIDAIVYALLAADIIQGLQIALIRTIRIPGTQALFSGILGAFFAWHKFKCKSYFPGYLQATALHIIWNIITYLFHYFLDGIVFYIANFLLLGIYLTFLSVISTMLVQYDKKNFPLGFQKEKKKQKSD